MGSTSGTGGGAISTGGGAGVAGREPPSELQLIKKHIMGLHI